MVQRGLGEIRGCREVEALTIPSLEVKAKSINLYSPLYLTPSIYAVVSLVNKL